MADKGIVSRAKVEALVESIRAKTGVTGPLSFDAMKTAVDGINSGGGGPTPPSTPLDSVAYYKANRNPEYPYFPLPSEMEETQDTIYMLYEAKGYMCCPAFLVGFADCVCTVYKYNNTTLVSSYVEPVTSWTTKYMQFSEEDSDYSTYNYLVIKLQGTITAHHLDYASKFNGFAYNNSSSSELIEVSGKCNSCDIRVVNYSAYSYHRSLEYYSFLGINTTDMYRLFNGCSSLQAIPELDTSNVTDMSEMFFNCFSLQKIFQFNTSKTTTMLNMFCNCSSLQTIPELNTSNVTIMSSMFSGCYSLQIIPKLNTSNVTSMSNMFNNCYSLQTVIELDTSNATDISGMFIYCYSLQTIPELDTSKTASNSYIFYNCYILAKALLTNIKINLQVGSGTSYGHLLTLDSLIGLCKECVYVGEARTLTIGSANLDKLLGKVFLKFKDPSVGEVALGEKGDVELCEASTTSSFGISDYMAMKNWTLA